MKLRRRLGTLGIWLSSQENPCQESLVRVAVVCVLAYRAGHLFEGDYATIQFAATGVLELDGRVRDLEMFLQYMIDVDEDAGAFRRRNVVDADMAGEGAGV